MAKKARKKAKPAKAKKAKSKVAVKAKVVKKAKKATKAAKAKAVKKAPVKAKAKTKAKRKPAKSSVVKTVTKAAKKLVVAVKRAVNPKPKKKDVIGEGNYTASRNFRKAETDYIDNNRATITRKAKEAEAAIDGPEGAELEAARIETAAHSHGDDEE